ncbi:hypothetical protein BI049_gp163 [Salmonella phage vB_SnwM_CGG4-1]|uniref:Uncharacterized protein n=1 Tax=Salmonella phage vB_SnwM_CGG4-1 TaxID=1815631 RepID=A0A1B0VVG9_9CAUD|nr:hypothetical protein BI049_gp163 [Salmonella phage vB_SnwM_CGG4-1]ANA49570.1 hypothetical protein CGG41_215 [Salmonella phage vB_SnwM_CGG4-1]
MLIKFTSEYGDKVFAETESDIGHELKEGGQIMINGYFYIIQSIFLSIDMNRSPVKVVVVKEA